MDDFKIISAQLWLKDVKLFWSKCLFFNGACKCLDFLASFYLFFLCKNITGNIRICQIVHVSRERSALKTCFTFMKLLYTITSTKKVYARNFYLHFFFFLEKLWLLSTMDSIFWGWVHLAGRSRMSPFCAGCLKGFKRAGYNPLIK